MNRFMISSLVACLFFTSISNNAEEPKSEPDASVIKSIFSAVKNSAPEIRRKIPKRSWGPEQAIGQPDTPDAGDIETAWASQTQDEKNEWLELEYAEAVEPTVIIVHENHNPGAVYKITAYSKSNMEAELWSGEDPTPIGKPRGVSEIEIDVKYKTKRIRLYIKSKEVPGWNEIDAVGIKDKDGDVQWAINARASSSYASTDEPDNGIPIPSAEDVNAEKEN